MARRKSKVERYHDRVARLYDGMYDGSRYWDLYRAITWRHLKRDGLSRKISFIVVMRGVPLLVTILYIGYVLVPMIRNATDGNIDLQGVPAAVIAMAICYGAYLAEVYRSGIESIERGQMEAARSLGMSYIEAMRYVILPQAIRRILPPLGNDFISMLKDSSLIAVIALPDLLQMGRLYVSRTFRAFEGYNTVALLYLVLTLFLSLLVRIVERRTAIE